jgi:hypothetical protein
LGRSRQIWSRVRTKLKFHNVGIDDLVSDQIYDELTQGQNAIIAKVNPDKEITLTIEDGVDEYPLTTDTVTDPALTTYRNNITSVKLTKIPDNWRYPLVIVPNDQWIEQVNGVYDLWVSISSLFPTVDFSSYIKTGEQLTGLKNGVNTLFVIPEDIVEDSEEILFNGITLERNVGYTIVNSTITILGTVIPNSDDSLTCNYIKRSTMANAIVNTQQPLLGTIIGGRLKVYPVPDSSYDGDEIKLWVYKKSGGSSISSTVEPEVDPEFDKALEYFALAELIPDRKISMSYKADFNSEVEEKAGLSHRKTHNLQRASVW